MRAYPLVYNFVLKRSFEILLIYSKLSELEKIWKVIFSYRIKYIVLLYSWNKIKLSELYSHT